MGWRWALGSAVTHPPAARGGTAFAGTESGTVHAVSVDDGRERWSADVGRTVQARPVVADGAVFVVSGGSEIGASHEVRALEAESGRERWRFVPESKWLDPLGARDGTLYVGTTDDAVSGEGETLYALATDPGTRRWSAEIGDPMGGVVTDDVVYVPSYGRLYAYDATDGTLRWTRETTDYSYRTLAVTDGRVVFVAEVEGSRGGIVALDTATGERAWSFDGWLATSTTLADGVLYAGGEHVAAFDPVTGERRWQADEAGFVPRVPVQGGVLYAGGDGVRAHAVEDGTVRWSWTPDPAVQGATPAGLVEDALLVDSYGDGEPRNRYKFAVDVDTGEGRWAFDGGTELTPLAPGRGYGFVGGADGSLYALGPT